MPLENAVVVGLLGVIATVDVAQFGLQLRQAKKIARLEAKTE